MYVPKRQKGDKNIVNIKEKKRQKVRVRVRVYGYFHTKKLTLF